MTKRQCGFREPHAAHSGILHRPDHPPTDYECDGVRAPDGPVWSDFTELLALDAFADDIIGWAETMPPRRPTEFVMKGWATTMQDASRRLRIANPEAAAMADRHGNPAYSPYLPPGVAVDGEGRWWLLPGHPMPAGAMYRYRSDDEWRTPVFAADSPEMTTCWSQLQAHEIRLAL